MNDKERLDALVSKTCGYSREYAKELIRKGFVRVDGEVVTKPSEKVTEADAVDCQAPESQFVSRGGHKLAAALAVFGEAGLSVKGKTCLDVGASTGGFTHCLLLNGARRVFAVDTGTGQLDGRLRQDERVVSMEKTNVNALTKVDFAQPIQFACVDVSFVSTTKIMEAVFSILSENGQAVWLIKPQFEVGRENVGKKGLVKDPRQRLRALGDVYEYAGRLGYLVNDVICSPIKGGSGNIEYLFYFDRTRQGLEPALFQQRCKKVVSL